MPDSQPNIVHLPPDDLTRKLTFARPETSDDLPHISLVGNTYTTTVSGKDTNGQFCVIDMLVPPGGGPAPHRHDFEETFIVLQGEVIANFRGEQTTVRAGETINIPANAPHQFHNAAKETARILCICSPAGQDEFFLQVGTRVPTRTSTAPNMSEEQQHAFMKKALELAPKYKTEMLDHL